MGKYSWEVLRTRYPWVFPIALHLLLISTQILGALTCVFIKFNTNYIHPLLVISIRHLIGVPLLFLYSYLGTESRNFKPTRSEWKGILGLGMLNIAFGTPIATYTVYLIGPVMVGIISALIPVTVCLLSRALGQETLNAFKIIGFIVAALGACIVIGFHVVAPEEKFLFFLGCAGQFFCVLTYSGYLTLQKPITKTVPIFFFLSRSFGIGCIPVFIVTLAIVSKEDYRHMAAAPVAPFLGILYNAVFQSGTMYWFTSIAIKHASSTTAAMYTNIQQFLIALFSYFILGEAMRWNHYVGMVVVFAGMTLSIYGKHLDEVNQKRITNHEGHGGDADGKMTGLAEKDAVHAMVMEGAECEDVSTEQR
eukprot:PhF_6_TR32350/c0_g1_i2/m.47971